MKITTEYLAVRVVKRFHDMGGPGQCTRQFEKFRLSDQSSMLDSFQLNAEELPLVACFLDRSCWTLITTERLIRCTSDQAVGWWRLDHIEEATVDMEEVAKAGEKWKLFWDRLIVRSDGEQVELRLEPGRKPFFAFWNALRDAIRISRRRNAELEEA